MSTQIYAISYTFTSFLTYEGGLSTLFTAIFTFIYVNMLCVYLNKYLFVVV